MKKRIIIVLWAILCVNFFAQDSLATKSDSWLVSDDYELVKRSESLPGQTYRVVTFNADGSKTWDGWWRRKKSEASSPDPEGDFIGKWDNVNRTPSERWGDLWVAWKQAMIPIAAVPFKFVAFVFSGSSVKSFNGLGPMAEEMVNSLSQTRERLDEEKSLGGYVLSLSPFIDDDWNIRMGSARNWVLGAPLFLVIMILGISIGWRLFATGRRLARQRKNLGKEDSDSQNLEIGLAVIERISLLMGAVILIVGFWPIIVITLIVVVIALVPVALFMNKGKSTSSDDDASTMPKN